MKSVQQGASEVRDAMTKLADATEVLVDAITTGCEGSINELPGYAVVEIMNSDSGPSLTAEMMRAEINLQRAINWLGSHRTSLERRHAQAMDEMMAQSVN